MSDSTTITIRVPRELKRQIEKAASAEARTISNLAAIFLERGVRHQKVCLGCKTPEKVVATKIRLKR